MLAKILIFVIALIPLTGNLQAAFWDVLFTNEVKAEPKKIKVLIVDDKPGALVEVRGKHGLYDPNRIRKGQFKQISSRFLPKRKVIQAVSDGIRWGEEFPGIFQLLIQPEEESTKIAVDGVHYKGSLYIYNIAETGTISIVNEVEIDDYLNSILSHLYNEKFGDEAFAALAIAARTKALYEIEHPKSSFFAVDAREVGYVGHEHVQYRTPIGKAIEATKQMVLSQTQPGGILHPFPADWKAITGQQRRDAKLAQISVQEVQNLAQKGDHAAEILKKAFPGTMIQLTE